MLVAEETHTRGSQVRYHRVLGFGCYNGLELSPLDSFWSFTWNAACGAYPKNPKTLCHDS